MGKLKITGGFTLIDHINLCLTGWHINNYDYVRDIWCQSQCLSVMSLQTTDYRQWHYRLVQCNCRSVSLTLVYHYVVLETDTVDGVLSVSHRWSESLMVIDNRVDHAFLSHIQTGCQLSYAHTDSIYTYINIKSRYEFPVLYSNASTGNELRKYSVYNSHTVTLSLKLSGLSLSPRPRHIMTYEYCC